MSVLPFLVCFTQYHMILHMSAHLLVFGCHSQNWCPVGSQPIVICSTQVVAVFQGVFIGGDGKHKTRTLCPPPNQKTQITTNKVEVNLLVNSGI